MKKVFESKKQSVKNSAVVGKSCSCHCASDGTRAFSASGSSVFGKR